MEVLKIDMHRLVCYEVQVHTFRQTWRSEMAPQLLGVHFELDKLVLTIIIHYNNQEAIERA